MSKCETSIVICCYQLNKRDGDKYKKNNLREVIIESNSHMIILDLTNFSKPSPGFSVL